MKTLISNSFSTGGGGVHFENRVQASFLLMMLFGGYAPGISTWPIIKIKFQGKHEGYETDDFIIFCEDPITKNRCKILGQIKHFITFTKSNKELESVLDANWKDFNNKQLFNEDLDQIALICGPLSGKDTTSVRSLVELAKKSNDSADFFNKISIADFVSNDQREKIEVIRDHLDKANTELIQDNELWRFLRSFNLFICDLDIDGVYMSLLNSMIGMYSLNDPLSLWTKLLDFVEKANERAGSVNNKELPYKLKSLIDAKTEVKIPPHFFQYNDIILEKLNSSEELIIAWLIGCWDEKNKNDKDIIESTLNVIYDDWIKEIRKVCNILNSPIKYYNGIWVFENRLKFLALIKDKIYDSHLNKFEILALTVLSKTYKNISLYEKIRESISEFIKIDSNYSDELRNGLAESLTLISIKKDDFNNCSLNRPEILINKILNELLRDKEWQIWPSLNEILPFLAESNPAKFLTIIEEKINEDESFIKNSFILEKNTGWFYLNGFLHALEALAWSEEYLKRVTLILGEFAKHDPGGSNMNRPINSLISIYIPWVKHTLASYEKRKIAISVLIKENKEVAWDLLLNLLPNVHHSMISTYKPKYLIQIDSEAKITRKEYFEQVEYYSNELLNIATNDFDKLTIIIKHTNNLIPPIFDKLVDILIENDFEQTSQEKKYIAWDELADIINRNKRFSEMDWTLTKEQLSLLEQCLDKLVPSDYIIKKSRLFKRDYFELYEKNDNYDEEDEKLKQKQISAIKEIFCKGGLPNILCFVKQIETPEVVGELLGEIADDNIDSKIIPYLLNKEESNIKQFVIYFIKKRFFLKNKWIDKFNYADWDTNQKLVFISGLPMCIEVWDKIECIFPDNEEIYWLNVKIDHHRVLNNINYLIDKLIQYQRYYDALLCISRGIESKSNYNVEKIILVLLRFNPETKSSMDGFYLGKIIEYLQTKPEIIDELLKIELKYYSFFKYDYKLEFKTIEDKLLDPYFFISLIQTAFRGKDKEVAEVNFNVPGIKAYKEHSSLISASSSYQILSSWKTTPYIKSKINANNSEYKKWIATVKDECKKSGHIDIALQIIGEVLYYSPEDKTGFWVNESVADELNKKENDYMREGYYSKAINPREFYWVDPEAKPEKELEKKYYELYKKTEIKYHRFADTLKQIAEHYKREAKQILNDNKKYLNK